MSLDITFFMTGTTEERLPQFVSPDSPLELNRKVEHYHILQAKDRVLDGDFLLSRPDSEEIEYPLHIEAQGALGMKAESVLYYPGCKIKRPKVEAFRDIMEFLTAGGVPHYMTVTNEVGDDFLIRGYNPITGVEIKDPAFAQDMLKAEAK